jgi:hypothetical protein
MSLKQSDVVLRRQPARIEAGPCVVSMRVVVPIKEALAVGDIIELAVLPADCVIVDAMLDADDLDSNATQALAYDVGLMSGPVGLKDANRTVSNQLFAGATTGQAAGAARATARSAFAVQPKPVDRSIGLKVTTAPATAVVSSASGTNNRGLWQANTAYAVGDYIILPNGLRAWASVAGTSGVDLPLAFDSTLFGGTLTDGGVTWTIQDPYLALTVNYRSTYAGQ